MAIDVGEPVGLLLFLVGTATVSCRVLVYNSYARLAAAAAGAPLKKGTKISVPLFK